MSFLNSLKFIRPDLVIGNVDYIIEVVPAFTVIIAIVIATSSS